MHLNILKSCIFTIGIINVTLNSIITYFVWNQKETNDCPIQSNIALASGAMMTTALSVSWYMIIRETRPSSVHPDVQEISNNVSNRVEDNMERNFNNIGLSIKSSIAEMTSEIGIASSLMNDITSALTDSNMSRIESAQYSIANTHICSIDETDDNLSNASNYNSRGYTNYHPQRRISNKSPINNSNNSNNSNNKTNKKTIKFRRHSLPPILREEETNNNKQNPNSHDGIIKKLPNVSSDASIKSNYN